MPILGSRCRQRAGGKHRTVSLQHQRLLHRFAGEHAEDQKMLTVGNLVVSIKTAFKKTQGLLFFFRQFSMDKDNSLCHNNMQKGGI